MNKQKLIERMAKHTGLTKRDCGIALEGMLFTVTQALLEGEPVKLSGFGCFEAKRRAARTGRNPRTKEAVEIPAQILPVFKAGKSLKVRVSSQAQARQLPKA